MKRIYKSVFTISLCIIMLIGTAAIDKNFITTSSFAVDEDATFFNGNYYKIYTGKYSWETAKTMCENMGGHLATITSNEEDVFIQQLNVSNLNLWIGASRDDYNNWMWVTGEEWNYTNWNSGEPNNSNNVVPNENCVAVWPKYWNDLNTNNTSEQNGYICEWESNEDMSFNSISTSDVVEFGDYPQTSVSDCAESDLDYENNEIKKILVVQSLPSNIRQSDELLLKFNTYISKNLNWDNGSIIIKNSYNDSDLIRISNANDFYKYGGFVKDESITLKYAFSNLKTGQYKLIISNGLISSKGLNSNGQVVINDDIEIRFNIINDYNLYEFKKDTYSFSNYGYCGIDDCEWSGHCFGMSATSAGFSLGILDFDKVSNGKDNLYSIDKEPVKSLIHFYQNRQGELSDNSIVAGGYFQLNYKEGAEKHNSSYKPEQDWKEVIEYVKDHSYDNTGTLAISHKNYGEAWGHIVNFLYYENVDGEDRLYVYDNIYPNSKCYYYMNSKNQICRSGTVWDDLLTLTTNIGSITLSDWTKYYNSVEEYDEKNYIYAFSGEILVEQAKIYLNCADNKEGAILTYKIPEGQESIIIKPKKDNAQFTYCGKEYVLSDCEYAILNRNSNGENKIEYISASNEINENIIPEYNTIVTGTIIVLAILILAIVVITIIILKRKALLSKY